jgi:hypothetical protein
LVTVGQSGRNGSPLAKILYVGRLPKAYQAHFTAIMTAHGCMGR